MDSKLSKPVDLTGFRSLTLEHGNLIGLGLIIVGFWVFFALKVPGFVSSFNIFVLLRSLSIDVVIGFSTMVVLATGGMNLAIGSIGVCAVMFSGYLMQSCGISAAPAVVAGLALGIVLGWINGVVIVRTGVSAFIVTLATTSLYSGAMLILTKAQIYNQIPPGFATFARMQVGVVPVLLLVALAVGLGLLVLFRYSVLGREILSTGANARAAELSGVRVNRVIIFVHALSGFLAALAGILLLSRLGAAMPSIGQDWLLPSFLAPVLGGTLLAGGFVSVVGTVLGALLVATIRSGLLVMQVGSFWLQLFLGLILLLALFIERYRTLYSARRSKLGGR
ncbi:ABC transporter permease [Pseudomonas fluorescens]|uniref:Autoinducer 2 import system permease protein LsrC n=1 Tax=Pseudomonas fluorescens TaxID=294 RepID=A0A327N6J2_PSEFL|nr:ABC transporter permease [Pseudomonas fluorescens]RAI70867.1 ABC transporter permease [Pseudomonas fluorescens]